MATPWMPIVLDDYVAETNGLTTLEHGAFNLITMLMWHAGGSLPYGKPYDEDVLRRIGRVSKEEWPDVWKAIKPLFVLHEGRITRPRMAEQMAAAGKCKHWTEYRP